MIKIEKERKTMINTQFLAMHNSNEYSYLLSKMQNT